MNDVPSIPLGLGDSKLFRQQCYVDGEWVETEKAPKPRKKKAVKKKIKKASKG